MPVPNLNQVLTSTGSQHHNLWLNIALRYDELEELTFLPRTTTAEVSVLVLRYERFMIRIGQ